MIFIKNPSLDPFFNIATEEYLLKYLNVELMMLWRSTPSVVVGKHQNAFGEVNLPFLSQNNIPVVRRLSGGGTVYHDQGNVNFTLIRKMDPSKGIDFKNRIQPVVDFLQSFGIDAQFGGKNDIRIGDLKVSGNAQHVFRNRVLYHGTLLFDANLENLEQAIQSREDKFESKAIKSIRSRVANIVDFLPMRMELSTFMDLCQAFLCKAMGITGSYPLNSTEIQAIDKLVENKYALWDWNYGNSPIYSFSNRSTIEGQDIAVSFRVKKGMFDSIDILLNGMTCSKCEDVAARLMGTAHFPEGIKWVLQNTNFGNYNRIQDKWSLLQLFF